MYSNPTPGAAAEELLRREASAVPGRSNLHAGEADPAAAGADVPFGRPAVEDVLRNPRLKYVHLTSAGWDRYDRPDVTGVREPEQNRRAGPAEPVRGDIHRPDVGMR